MDSYFSLFPLNAKPDITRLGQGRRIYRTSATCLQDLHPFAIVLQPCLERSPSKYLEDPSNFPTGPHPIICRTPAMCLQDPNQFATGSQTCFYRIPTNYLQDPSHFSTRPHSIIYGAPATLRKDPSPIRFSAPAIVLQDRN